MDSVSQIVLGAAVGEAVLGKKLGNKAMFWGALGGTIPDLDIITKPLMSEVESLAFHRGISHSIVFAILGGLLFGWLWYRLYQSDYSKQILQAILSLFLSCIPISIAYFLIGSTWNTNIVAAVAIALSVGIFFTIQKLTRKNPDEVEVNAVNNENPSLRAWQLMFFLAFITHAILDSFTIYGTQLFLPFSDYRVAIGCISVSDPFGYTIPFLICLVIASRYMKTKPQRRFWNWLGIGISCSYLVFTLWHQHRVGTVFEKQMAEQNISYDRYVLGPTIFSNVLWNLTAENEEAFYMAKYSIFDTSPIQFDRVEKQHDLLPKSQDDKTINTLRWFSNDYYNVIERKDGLLQINDLRYGTFNNKGGESDYVFRFVVEHQSDGEYEMYQTKGGPDEGGLTEILGVLWTRMKGI